MVYFGFSLLSDEYQRQLAGNPTIEKHIGEIESLDFSWAATIDEAQQQGDQQERPRLGFAIEGTKGSGRMIVEQGQSGGGNMIRSAILVLSDGSRVPIDLSATSDDDEEAADLEPAHEPGDTTVDQPQPATNP